MIVEHQMGSVRMLSNHHHQQQQQQQQQLSSSSPSSTTSPPPSLTTTSSTSTSLITSPLSTSTAIVDVQCYDQESRTIRLFSTYPIRLIESLIQHQNIRKRYREDSTTTTTNPTASYVTIFVIGFGGGSVSGDNIKIDINVGIGANLCIRTQGSSKVYKTECDKAYQQQQICCNIHSKGFLVMTPDHTVCYEDSNYKQEQIYNINENGSLVLVDWISSGRLLGGRKESSTSTSSSTSSSSTTTTGEFWKMRRYRSKIQVNNDANQCLFLDNIDLYNSRDENNDVIFSIGDKVGDASIFGSIVLLGPSTSLLRERVSVLMQRQSFHKMKEALNKNVTVDVDKNEQAFFYHEPLVSVSSLSESLVVVRFAAGNVEDAYILVKAILKPLGQEIGQYPYADKVHSNKGEDWHCVKELRNYDEKNVVI